MYNPKLKLSDIHTLQIEPTSFCNARCPHCPRFDSNGQVHADLDLDQLREMTGGFDNQDLNRYTLSQVFGHQFFARTLYDSLKTGHWHFNCARSCKSQIKENIKHVNPPI